MKSIGVVLRSAFGYDTDAASKESGLECKDKSLTIQSQAEEADINKIVERFGLTGQVPQNVRVPLQEDFIDLITYQEALNAIKEAEASFNAMPAFIRSRFENDPGRFVAFCSEETVDSGTGEVRLKNIEEMRKMGLAVSAITEQGNVKGKPVEGAVQ